jgi:hypothetical protein
MAFLHSSLYSNSIVDLCQAEDQALNSLLATYKQQGIQFRDFGVGLDVLPDLHAAIITLARLSSSVSGFVLPRNAAGIFFDLLSSPTRIECNLSSIEAAKTPLRSIGLVRQMLDEVVHAVESIGPLTGRSRGIGTDELIPLLAYVTVQAQPQYLESLLFYVTRFRLSDTLAPDLE